VPLRDRYGAISNDTDWVERWLAGPVADALKRRADATPIEAVAAEPFLLRLSRGQVVIRQAAPTPRVGVLQACVDVAEAVDAALRKTA
jgi:hypothetical protein